MAPMLPLSSANFAHLNAPHALFLQVTAQTVRMESIFSIIVVLTHVQLPTNQMLIEFAFFVIQHVELGLPLRQM